MVFLGLDGAVGLFHLRVESGDRIDLDQSYVLHAHDDLVAAVDFTEEFMVTGHEDSTVGVWDVKSRPMRSLRVLPGIQIFGSILLENNLNWHLSPQRSQRRCDWGGHQRVSARISQLRRVSQSMEPEELHMPAHF